MGSCRSSIYKHILTLTCRICRSQEGSISFVSSLSLLGVRDTARGRGRWEAVGEGQQEGNEYQVRSFMHGSRGHVGLVHF